MKARFGPKIQKTRAHPEPSISVLKNRIFNWDPGRSWGEGLCEHEVQNFFDLHHLGVVHVRVDDHTIVPVIHIFPHQTCCGASQAW